MPELPEVETVRRDLDRWMTGRKMTSCDVYNPALRAPVPRNLRAKVVGKKVLGVERRAKYILAKFSDGIMGIHLGMSGSVRVELNDAKLQKHDHVVWRIDKLSLHFNDPRRFGMIFWHEGGGVPKALRNAGMEPLERGFNSSVMLAICSKRACAIKQLIMDSRLIAGVGNIYASESLFRSKIHPAKPARKLTEDEAQKLVREIKAVLRQAIRAGGSTLRDYRYGKDKIGYFQNKHNVYGKQGEPCSKCSTPIARIVLGQRATFLCPSCQVL